MPRADTADETVTVRVPKGTADKVRAATGQPFSTVVRWMVTQLLERKAAEMAGASSVKEQQRESVQVATGEALDGQS